MPLNANKVPHTGGSKVTQPTLEPGGYPGRLVQVIDLGLQPQPPYQGQEKPPAYKINLTYELSDEFCVDEEGNEEEDRPRWISEMIPVYPLDSDKAKSTQRYLSMDPNQEHDGDFSLLLSSPVTINLVNNPKGEKVYTNVASLSPMRAKDAAKVPELVNEPVMFSLEEPDLDVFNNLPDFLKEIIKGNLEFAGSPLQKLLNGEEPEAQSGDGEDTDTNTDQGEGPEW